LEDVVMMQKNLENVKDTIRKLLNLADSSTFEGEIANALKFAHRLMSEHHLKPADVNEQVADEEAEEFAKEGCSTNGVNMATWEGSLGMFVADMVGGIGCYRESSKPVLRNGCRVFERNGRARCRSTVHFYGFAEEVELAVDLYNRLAHTIAAMGRLRYGGVLRGEGRSYGDGFVAGLRTQLKEVERKALEGTGRELAIRSTRIAERKRAMAENWLVHEHGIRLRNRGRSGARHHHGAFGRGREDGQRADGSPGAKTLRIGG
jgi:hypothetical protein